MHFFLSNLWEYRHINHVVENWILWATFFVADSMSNFNYCDVIAWSKCPNFSEVTQNNSRYAVRHSTSPISIPMDSLNATSYLWNLPPLHRFRDMTYYWSNFRPRHGVPLFNHLMQSLGMNYIRDSEIWPHETRNSPLLQGAKHILIT